MRCSACGQESRDTASFCVNCGANLSEAGILAQSDQTSEKRCLNCGAVIANDAMFCKICGKSLMAEANSIKPVEVSENKIKFLYKKWWFYLVLGLVIVVAAIAFGGPNSEERQMIAVVRDGYFGDCTSMTVEQVLGNRFFKGAAIKGDWEVAQMEDGQVTVRYFAEKKSGRIEGMGSLKTSAEAQFVLEEDGQRFRLCRLIMGSEIEGEKFIEEFTDEMQLTMMISAGIPAELMWSSDAAFNNIIYGASAEYTGSRMFVNTDVNTIESHMDSVVDALSEQVDEPISQSKVAVQTIYYMDYDWVPAEYAPSLALYADGTFSLTDNFYSGVETFAGKYSYDGSDIKLIDTSSGLKMTLRENAEGVAMVSGMENLTDITGDTVLKQCSVEEYKQLLYNNSEYYEFGEDEAWECFAQYWDYESEMNYISLDDCYGDVSEVEEGYLFEVRYSKATTTSDLLGYYLVTEDYYVYDYVTGNFLFEASAII